MKSLCFICPSRGRIKKLKKLILSFIENSTNSSLYVVYDFDDAAYKEYYQDNKDNLESNRVYFLENSIDFAGAFLHIMNHYALEKASSYDLVGFLEDDCVIQTNNFDSIISSCKEKIIYTNDLLNTPRIVSLPVIDSKVITKMGYYSPPEIKCLWADYYWKMLGSSLGSIKYLDNVIIKHEHYSVMREDKDFISIQVDKIGKQDYVSYHKNLDKFKKDIEDRLK